MKLYADGILQPPVVRRQDIVLLQFCQLWQTSDTFTFTSLLHQYHTCHDAYDDLMHGRRFFFWFRFSVLLYLLRTTTRRRNRKQVSRYCIGDMLFRLFPFGTIVDMSF